MAKSPTIESVTKDHLARVAWSKASVDLVGARPDEDQLDSLDTLAAALCDLPLTLRQAVVSGGIATIAELPAGWPEVLDPVIREHGLDDCVLDLALGAIISAQVLGEL
jgi:hypothetical protein